MPCSGVVTYSHPLPAGLFCVVSGTEGLQVMRIVYLLVRPPEQSGLVLRRDVVYLACVAEAACVLAQVAIALEDEQAQALPFVTIATLGGCAA